jgi:hypothetical protein
MVKLKLMYGHLDTNGHMGWPTFGVIHGPKFKHVLLKDVHAPSTGHRFIFYFPSGSWWHVDVFFDRRDQG